MFNKLMCIGCGVSLMVGGYAEFIPEEILTSYFLSEEDISALKEGLDHCIRADIGEFVSFTAEVAIANDTTLWQKLNFLNKEEKTQYIFFILTNPEIRPYIKTLVQDKVKLEYIRYGLGYMEMEKDLIEFDLLEKNVSLLAKLLTLDESILRNYVNQKNYVDFFLYLAKGEPLTTPEFNK